MPLLIFAYLPVDETPRIRLCMCAHTMHAVHQKPVQIADRYRHHQGRLKAH